MPDSVAVASSVYNLGGDQAKRPDYLKSLVASSMLQRRPLARVALEGYASSFARRVSTFPEWARNDSDFSTYIGITSGSLPGTPPPDPVVVKAWIPHEPGKTIDRILEAVVSPVDVYYWVAQYMTKNYWGLGWTYVYSPSTNTVTATVYYHPGEGTVVFHPSGMVRGPLYLYVRYVTVDDKVFWSIYRRGSGIPALDAVVDASTPELMGTFYPPIPLRYDGGNIVEDSPNFLLRDAYPTCKRAFKRAFGSDYDQVMSRVLDNESIGQIDYVYAVLGVSLNTQKNSSRRYIYQFLKYLLVHAETFTAAAEMAWLKDWESGKSRPTPPWKRLTVESKRSGVSSYRTDIKWGFLHEDVGTGKLRPGVRTGELFWEIRPDPLTVYPASRGDGFNQQVVLYWQETGRSWRKITATGLQYNNFVYVAKSTQVTAKVALDVTDRDSEFLVPLHEGMYEALPFVHRMEMGSDCSFLIFNCLEVHKEQWYETDEFRLLTVVGILAVSIGLALFTGGGSLVAGEAAIVVLATSAGISASAAIVILAAAEAIAGLIVSMLITAGTTALFGEKWGPVIGSIISVLFTFGLSAGSLSGFIDALAKPDVWMSLAVATGNGVASFLQGEAVEVSRATAEEMESYGRRTAEVQRLYQELSGRGGGIDLSLVSQYISETSEKPVDFLRRTLITGSDIVGITLGQVEDFAKNNLKLVLP